MEPPSTVKVDPVASPVKSSAPMKPAAKTAPVEITELAPWEHAAHDTDNPAAKDDTASRSDLDLPKEKRPQKTSTKALAIIGVLVTAFVVLPICLTTGIFATLWIVAPPKPAPTPEPPPTLAVSKDPNRKGFRSIKQALANAKIGSTIELWDDAYDENVVIDTRKDIATGLTLQAAPGREGKEIVWRSGTNDPTVQILWIARSADFKLKGKGITFDGTIAQKPNVNNLVMITGENPNLLMEDFQFKSFAQSAILIMNATGKTERPVQLHRLWTITQADEKPRGAIYFDANPNVTPAKNDHIEIVDCEFRGIDAGNAIQMRDEKILGANVRFPGR